MSLLRVRPEPGLCRQFVSLGLLSDGAPSVSGVWVYLPGLPQVASSTSGWKS